MPDRVTQKDTQSMALCRKKELAKKFPELKRGDFADEKAYREALINQYQSLRYQEYEYVVRNESNRAYNDACEGRSQGVHENQFIWNSGADINLSSPSDSTKVAQTIVVDIGLNPGGMCRQKNKDNKGRVKSTGAYSCAIEATALQSAISMNMGYDGPDNIIQVSRGSAYAGAKTMAKEVPVKYYQEGKGRTLNQMVASGDIQVGDAVSIKSGQGKEINTNSQCHCLTIAAINRDEKGNVVSYTVEAYNNCQFVNIDVKNNAHFFGGHVVLNAVKTHDFIDDKIGEEVQNLQNLSTRDLELRVSDARKRTEQVIDELQVTEAASTGLKKTMTEPCYDSSIVTQYHKDLLRLQGQYTSVATNHTGLKGQLMAQRGELPEDSSDIHLSGAVILGEGPMYKETETYVAVAALHEEDGRPVFEALHDGKEMALGDTSVSEQVAEDKKTKFETINPVVWVMMNDRNRA